MWMLGEFPKNKFANFPEKFKVGIKKKKTVFRGIFRTQSKI